MNKDLKNGILVAGGAILLYLLYKNSTAVKEQPNTIEQPIEQRGGVALPLVPKKPTIDKGHRIEPDFNFLLNNFEKNRDSPMYRFALRSAY
jgi:hypothetical protein